MTQPDPHADEDPPPPQADPASTRATTSYALKFLGLIVTCAGALALIRTGERSLFYAMLMPAGLIMWAIGFFLARPGDRDRS